MRVGLGLILTGRCNLACAYCYQRSGADSGTLSLAAVRSSVAAALELGPQGIDAVFSGGKPLLEAGLLTHCIDELVQVVPADVDLSVRVITNGVLLDRRLTDFLAGHGVDVQLSLHELPGGRGFAPAYDRLGRLIDDYPVYSRNHLSTATVVPSWRVAGLARNVQRLLELGVQDIHLAVPFTPDPGWTAGTDAMLERELETILEASTAYWRERGVIPVACLRTPKQAHNVGRWRPRQPICRAGSGTMFAVDPGGHAWVCACFAPTLHALPPLAEGASRGARSGSGGVPDAP